MTTDVIWQQLIQEDYIAHASAHSAARRVDRLCADSDRPFLPLPLLVIAAIYARKSTDQGTNQR